ncbi:hypothetical protein Tcan_15043 [Toxocara canis]|uniref:PDZ domain-containing protein n=1 Tax=Toxocara canis TaxID=6265 RepID=A0A0B2VTQ8_TOXCA|nr:hypothetical protein Tcan_15043 [Toxocara canis]
MKGFPIGETPDDCVRDHPGKGMERAMADEGSGKQRREETELSASSSEEFEVIREKEAFVDVGSGKKFDFETMQSKFNSNKMDQSWSLYGSLTKRSTKYENNAPTLKHTASLIDKQCERDEMPEGAYQTKNSNQVNAQKDFSFKSYSGVIIISFLCIIISSLFIPVFHFRLLQDQEATREDVMKDATILKQNRLIEQLQMKIESLQKAAAETNNVLIKSIIDEERSNAFERRVGYDYRLVIVDWKKANVDGHRSRQHLRLSLKQCNGSIFVYDHGPTSGKLFAVGDRIIDIDGRHFVTTVELKDHILWTFDNRDFFTSMIERPVSEEAKYSVAVCMQPSTSSFSTIVSTRP